MIGALVLWLATASAEARASYAEGRRLYEQGTDMAGALAALDEALRLAPDLAEAHLYRALVLLEDQQAKPGEGRSPLMPGEGRSPLIDDARPDFETAIRLAPDDKTARRFYADALSGAGELDAAEAQLRRALELDPAYGEAWYDLGALLRKERRTDDAIAAFEHDLTLRPLSPAHHDLGEIFLARSDDARAARELEADSAVDATCYDSRINLAGLDLSRGDFGAARDQYEISLTMHPADARALSGLGRAYLALDDDELAVGALRGALSRNPDDARAQAALGDARRRLRLHYGWPFAVPPAVVALALLGYIWVSRRRTPRKTT